MDMAMGGVWKAICGIRWDIKIFFKTTKSLLCFAKEFQGRSYGFLVAHTSTVFTRYIIPTLQRWRNKDKRSLRTRTLSPLLC